MLKKIALTTLLVAGLVPAAQASRVVLQNSGWDIVYLDNITARTGNQVLTLKVDTNNSAHGALNFSTPEGASLINCNLSGSTFTANGFTCLYTNNLLTGLSPAINVFKIAATGTSEKVIVSFGIKRL